MAKVEVVQLRGGFTTLDRRLDRLQEFDERSRDHPIGAVVPADVRTKVWRLSRTQYGDQGQEGACVEFGWTHELASQPVVVPINVLRRVRSEHLFYWPGQREDRWDGGSYPDASPFYEGTSVIAVARVVQRLGFIEGYRWAFSIDEGLRGVTNEGPAVIALDWDEGLGNPRPNGLARTEGRVTGGHCVAWIGNMFGHRLPGEPKMDLAVIAQSWGLDHGDRGRIYVSLDDLERKLMDGGEQCFPVGRRIPGRLS